MTEVVSFSSQAPLHQRLSVGWCMCLPYPVFRASAAQGLLTLREDALALEFGVVSATGEQQDLKKARMSLEQVRSVSMSSTVLGPTLSLKVKDVEPLVGLPGARGGDVMLRIPRSDESEARRLVARLTERLYELEVEALEGELDRLGRTGPTAS